MTADWEVLAALGLLALGCRAASSLAERFGQPAVVGQMLCGIVLGPSVLGLIAPHLMSTFLPAALVTLLGHLGQVGVALFALAIGAEVDTTSIRRSGPAAVSIAIGAMAVPMAAGVAVAAGFGAAAGVRQGAAGALFAGVAVSVTAFPVLCKILERIGLTRHPVGQLAVLVAALDDVVAWMLLAVVVAFAHAKGPFDLRGSAGVAVTLTAAVGIAVIMLGPVRWCLSKWRPSSPAAAAALVAAIALVAAAATAGIGLHAIFGGFLAGLCLPRRQEDELGQGLAAAQTINEVLLLPLFFLTAGLGVNLRNLAGHPAQLVGGLLLVLAALAGKPIGAWTAARFAGCDRNTSLALAALLSSRGLTELVILQVGLSLGVLSSGTYGLLVVMALVTTLAAGPLATAALRRRPEPDTSKVPSMEADLSPANR